MRAAFEPAQPEANDTAEARTHVPRSGGTSFAAARAEAARPASVTAERPRIFPRVPTHAVAMAHERRYCPRAYLRLPLRLTHVNHRAEPLPVTLLTQNISSSGVFFLAPRDIAPGTAIELEVALVERPLGRGSVRMATAAHVVRTMPADTLGWHGVAATFDDFDFRRDEEIPDRYI
jgi:hypothetical protein